MMNNINLKRIVKEFLPERFIRLFQNDKIIERQIDVKVINYQVNNFCNSKCVMCNVWKQNDSHHLTVKEFKKVLKDPLFQHVEHIGITGGEPTLVDNLPEYFSAAIQVLPNLVGLSTITNSLCPEKVISVIREIDEICQSHQKSFSVMLSLDGVDEIHDCNRGIPGNFKKTQQVISSLKEAGIPFTTGTTITKFNVWNLDELLIFLRENNIYGRFRIAEFINRLDNSGNVEYIKNFNADETYQLMLFFSKLEYSYEQDEGVKNTYRSIKNMLKGGKRLISCPYKEKIAVNLDCHGGLAYCAPKSKIIGNLLKKSGLSLYINNLEHLEHIKQTYCDLCIHDYHYSPSSELARRLENEQYWRQFFTVARFVEHKDSLIVSHKQVKPNDYTVFIIGWYGTETVGDKAILGGIIEHYNKKFSQVTFVIGSLHPFITERTIQELSIEAQIVPVFSENFFAWASIADEVVVGGGPLMELEELSLILWAFHFAKKNKAKTTVFGSGIGPLYTEEKINAVKDILTLADSVHLRDEGSVKAATSLTCKTDIQNIGDPAIRYLRQNYSQVKVREKNGLACFLRELTIEYRGEKSAEEFFEYKQKFEEALAANIINICDKYGLVPRFYSMHNFVIGNDDRDFNFNFTHKYFSGREYYVEDKLSTVESIVDAMKSSRLNLCMRFHSVVFANTLNTDFIAIDYTSGGKIKGYLSDVEKIQHMITLDSILQDNDNILSKFGNL